MLKKTLAVLSMGAILSVGTTVANIPELTGNDSVIVSKAEAALDSKAQSKINSIQGNWRASDGTGIAIAGNTLNNEEISSYEISAGGASNYSANITVLTRGWLPEKHQINVELTSEDGRYSIHPRIKYKGVTYYKCEPSGIAGSIILGGGYGTGRDYAVDKNTVISIGTAEEPAYNVYVYEYDDYVNMPINCTFKKIKGEWKYKWKHTGYKSNKNSGGWQKVAGSKLPNDVLYVIMN